MPGALLVTREDVAHGRAARHRVVEREDRAARQPEHHLDTLGLERAEHCVCAVHRRTTPILIGPAQNSAFRFESWKPATTREVNSRVVAPTPRRSRSGVCGPSTSAAETAPASVAAAAGRSEAVLERHRRGEEHAARVDGAAAGDREAAVGRRDEEARPVLGEQAVRRDARSRRRGGDLHHRLGPGGRDRDDVEPARVERCERERDPGREMLDLHVIVCDGDGIRELVPGSVADDGEPHAACLCDAKCRLERPFARVVVERRDERDVVVQTEAHLRDACAQVELCHHLGERRLLRARDEHGLGSKHGRPGRCGECLSASHDGDAAEGNVHLVDRQTVQARDRLECEDGLGHQLRRGAGACQAGDCRSMAHAATSVNSSSRVTAAPVSASALKRWNAEFSFSPSRTTPISAHA